MGWVQVTLTAVLAAFDRLTRSLKWLFEWGSNYIVSGLLLALTPAIAIFLAIWVIMVRVWNWILDYLGSIVIPIVDQPAEQLFSVANTFVPLEEAFYLVFAYLGIIEIIGVYRFIKSYFPTVSS